MTTVRRWTGLEAKLLREALRLSVRDFAAHLGVGTRTINKWKSRLAISHFDLTCRRYWILLLCAPLARRKLGLRRRYPLGAHG